MLTTIVSVACLAGWFVSAAVLLVASRVMARHGLASRRRRAAATTVRIAFTTLLVATGGLVIVGVMAHGGALASRYGLGQGWAYATVALIGVLVFVAIVTLAFPELPGRIHLRRIENAGFWLLVPALTLVFLVGGRGDNHDTGAYGTAGALALVIAFTMAARPFLRGAVVIVSRIGTQGTHPGTEATLKRLLRRCRPFIVAAAAALVVCVLLA